MTHFSELTVDKYLAGELGRDAVASLRAHAAECARCGDALEDALAVKARSSRRAVPLWRRARVLVRRAGRARRRARTRRRVAATHADTP